jgi:CheY-like chemotaxis protein
MWKAQYIETARDGATRASGQQAEERRPVVLVIEADSHDRDYYGQVLWYNGFDVLYSNDGEAGLRLARETEPDLVLLDLDLPTRGGAELCERLRADRALARVPIVGLTEDPLRVRRDDTDRCPCSMYIDKPVHPLDVLHAVEMFVGRPPLPGG